jgi:hypothetical protein
MINSNNLERKKMGCRELALSASASRENKFKTLWEQERFEFLTLMLLHTFYLVSLPLVSRSCSLILSTLL